MNFLYKIVLTFNATSWMIVVYGMNQRWQISDWSRFVTNLFFLLLPIVLSGVSLAVARRLGSDSMSECLEFSLADNEFLPIYLGYFFVSLSIDDNTVMLFLYGIVFVFTWFSQTQYFNPLYLLLDYHYYHVMTKKGTRIFIIVPGDVIRNRDDMSFNHLRRINNTTYIALRGDK